MKYHFDIVIAQEFGVNAAIVINNLQFWIEKNKANGKHFHDGRYWTYNSMKDWTALFPFWTERQVRKILEDLVEKNIVMKGHYNQVKYDRTLWYAFTDYGISVLQIGQKEATDVADRSDRNVEPIPDINSVIKTDVNTDKKGDPSVQPESTEIQMIETGEVMAISTMKSGQTDLNEVVAEFNQTVMRLPKVTTLTTKRQSQIRTRIREHGREALSLCFLKTDKSDFLCGVNDRGWMASFDWIMKPENFIRIIEGVFDNKVAIPKHLQGAVNNLTKQMSVNQGGDIFGL